jgi:hypothetical protein
MPAASYPVAASYQAAPPRHEALDGYKRCVECVLQKLTCNALYYSSLVPSYEVQRRSSASVEVWRRPSSFIRRLSSVVRSFL